MKDKSRKSNKPDGMYLSDATKSLIHKYDPKLEEHDLPDFELDPDSFVDPEYGIQALMASMEEVGQGTPIISYRLLDERLRIIYGEPILYAARGLGWVSASTLVLDIRPEDVLPLMYALESAPKEKSYRLMSKRFKKAKEEYQQRKTEAKKNGVSMPETRMHLQKVFGFSNDKHVSQFEQILDAKHCDLILDQLDLGVWSFDKAYKKAKGDAPVPKPDPKKRNDTDKYFMCEDCPKRKQFLDQLDDTSNAYSIDDLNEENE